MNNEAIHTLAGARIFEELSTQPDGLTRTEAKARLQQYGSNTIREAKGKPLYVKLLANFTHLMAILLWIGGLIRKTADAVLRTDLSRVELPNLVFAGTSVAAGTGRAVVFATGMETEFGQIAHLT